MPRGTLKGGEKYTFTLTAMLADNPSSFSKASVDVDVTSSPLRIKLRGGLKRILGNMKFFCISLPKTRCGSLTYGNDGVSGRAAYTVFVR